MSMNAFTTDALLLIPGLQEHQMQREKERQQLPSFYRSIPKLSPRKAAIDAKASHPYSLVRDNTKKAKCQQRLHNQSDEESPLCSGSLDDMNCSYTLPSPRNRSSYQCHKQQQTLEDTIDIFQQNKTRKQPATKKPAPANSDTSPPATLEEAPEAPTKAEGKRWLLKNFIGEWSPKTPFREGSSRLILSSRKRSNIAKAEANKQRTD